MLRICPLICFELRALLQKQPSSGQPANLSSFTSASAYPHSLHALLQHSYTIKTFRCLCVCDVRMIKFSCHKFTVWMLECFRFLENNGVWSSCLHQSASLHNLFFFFLQAAAGTTSLKARKINLESPNKGMHLPLLLCFKSLEWRSPPTPRARSFSALFLRFAVSPSPLPDCHHCM